MLFIWTCGGCYKSTVINFKGFPKSTTEILITVLASFFNGLVYLSEKTARWIAVSGLFSYSSIPLLKGDVSEISFSNAYEEMNWS